MIAAVLLLLLLALGLLRPEPRALWRRQRQLWQLVWQLGGWRGVLQQPLLWLMLFLFLDPKSILEVLRRARKYLRRPLAVHVGRRVLLYVDDPWTMEQVLNAPECIDKTFMQDGFFARKGLLHAQGLKWKIRRKQLNPTFATAVLLRFLPTFDAAATRLREKISTLRGPRGERTAVELPFRALEELLSRAVLEVACQTTMGTEARFIERDVDGIARSYKRLLEISAMKTVKPWLQIDFLFRLLDRRSHDSGRTCNRLLERFVSEIVQRKHDAWRRRASDERRTHAASRQDHGGDAGEGAEAPQRKRIFIEQIFHLAENGELTLQDIMDESHSMVLVAFETVSNNILIALLCLAMHPDCQDKLRHEINRILPPSPAHARSAPDQNEDEEQLEQQELEISHEHLKQMKYLDMIVNESLRLLTTVPMNLRSVSRDFELRRPHRTGVGTGAGTGTGTGTGAGDEGAAVVVPEGTIVVLDNFNMQRDAELWGARSEEFDPERFAEPGEGEDEVEGGGGGVGEGEGVAESRQRRQRRRHPYAFTPFSKGLRWCIGWRYSVWLTKIFLVRLVRSHEFRTATKLQDLRFVEGISLKFRNCDSIAFAIRSVAAADRAKEPRGEDEEVEPGPWPGSWNAGKRS